MLALACALALGPTPAAAQGEASSGYSAVTGIGAAVCTLVYAPIKMVRAVGGTVVSGLALLFTFDTDVAGRIFSSSVRGDYVVTPAHLEGRRDLRFGG